MILTIIYLYYRKSWRKTRLECFSDTPSLTRLTMINVPIRNMEVETTLPLLRSVVQEKVIKKQTKNKFMISGLIDHLTYGFELS
jgi:hypothetical protein